MMKRIGDFFLEKGLITPEQLTEILEFSHRTGIRFGEAATSLKILTHETLQEIFGPHFKMDYSHVEPELYVAPFPDLLSVDEILEWGALPLMATMELGLFGQRKLLKVGFLNPSRKDATSQVEKRILARLKSEGIEGLKAVLLLPENFIAVLEAVFQISKSSLQKKKSSQLDPLLAGFIKSD